MSNVAPAEEPIGTSSDASLLARAAQGSSAAFAVIFDRHVDAVFWQAYHVVRNASDAQDVTQDVFVTTWRRRAEIRVDDSLVPWLLVTAKNIALNAHRKRVRLRSVPLETDPGDEHVEPELDAAAVRAAIDAAVAKLSPVDRELFDRCIDGDQTYAEAAAAVGLTHAAVRNRISRVRTRLRRDLHDLEEDA